MLYKIYESIYTYLQTFIECFCIWIKSTNFWNRRAEWSNKTLLEGDWGRNSSFITLWCKWTACTTGIKKQQYVIYKQAEKLLNGYFWEAELAKWLDKVSQGLLWALQYSPIFVKDRKTVIVLFPTPLHLYASSFQLKRE